MPVNGGSCHEHLVLYRSGWIYRDDGWVCWVATHAMSTLDALLAQADAGQVGAFSGYPLLEWRGPLTYWFKQQPYPLAFRFIRPDGTILTPDDIVTDGGSIPRALWNLPGLSPWDYLPAYLLHDWLFTKKPCSFDEANLILAEALLAMNCPRHRIVEIYEAVQLGGRGHWEA